MKLKKLFLSLILITSLLASLAGNSVPDSVFFSKYRQPKQSSFFLFSAGYRMPLNKNRIINSGHGIYIEGGINPGRFIPKNLVIGFYAGWGMMDRMWSTSFDQNFSTDFTASINKDQNFSALDSAVIYSFSDLMKNTKGNAVTLPGCDMRSFHNYSLYYGIVIRLPYKYFPIIKAYMGTTRTYYLGNGNIATKQKDFNAFQIRRQLYGCELIIFKGLQNLFRKEKLPSNKFTGALSFYYESCDFHNSSIYFNDGVNTTTIPLQKITSASFINKYKKETSMGFRICFYIM